MCDDVMEEYFDNTIEEYLKATVKKVEYDLDEEEVDKYAEENELDEDEKEELLETQSEELDHSKLEVETVDSEERGMGSEVTHQVKYYFNDVLGNDKVAEMTVVEYPKGAYEVTNIEVKKP